MKEFMRGLEDRIGDAHDELRDLIRLYLERVSIKDKADSFKSDLKEAERERKRLKKKEEEEAKRQDRDAMKEQLRKELLAEMADEQDKSTLEQKVGVKKMAFKNKSRRNSDSSEGDSSTLKTAFEEKRNESSLPQKKVVFKSSSSGESKKMDLATLSAFISKSSGMNRLGIYDQNEQELPFVQCGIIKDKIQIQVHVDIETILGSMIREGRFKMVDSRGKSLDVREMVVNARGKVELTVD